MRNRLLTWLLALGQVGLPFAAGVLLSYGHWLLAGGCGLVGLAAWNYVLSGTMNLVQGVGPVFWLVRNVAAPAKRLGIVEVRETDEPWRHGKGVYVVVRRTAGPAKVDPFWITVGFCKRRHPESEIDGLLDVLDGEVLDATPEEISVWGQKK